jgi:hypothetical protein
MSKCETYAKYVTLEEELEQFEEDEEENIAITYCSSDKRGLKGGKFGNSLNGLFRLSHSSHNGTNTKESHHREDQQTKSSSFDQKKESMDIDDFGCVGFQRQHKREEKYTGFTPREYDRALIAEQLRVLRVQRNSGDVEESMFGLRAELLRNLGNMISSTSPEFLCTLKTLNCSAINARSYSLGVKPVYFSSLLCCL